jgi:hypothetical protein
MTVKSIVRIVMTAIGAFCLAQAALAAEQPAKPSASQQAGDTWNHIRSYSADKKNQAVAYGKKLMKQSDVEFAKLQANAAKASGAAKEEFDKQVANLKVARAQAAAKLERMEKASGSAWNDAKEGFADAYRDMRKAYRRAVGHDK